MSDKLNNWPLIVITAIIGVLFTLWAKETSLFSWLVRAMGVCLILPGIYVFVQSFSKRVPSNTQPVNSVPTEIDFTMPETPQKESTRTQTSVSLLIASVCTVLLGFWLLITPDFFVTLFAILIACSLILYGIYQLIGLIYAARLMKLSWGFYIVPSLFIIAGVVVLATPVLSMNYVVSLATGILLIFSAVNAALQKVVMAKIAKNQQ